MTERIEGLVEGIGRARREIARVVVGNESQIELALVALLCEGHVLFEGVPGIGKTLLARSVAATLGLSFSRVQFTPDLMPADVIGTTMISSSGKDGISLTFERGPVFANVVLADEINRASPKTQSALLEAMQERSVTVRGTTHLLPRPFIVLATQNPLEMEGTYPLPEAQIDRFFFKVLIGQPDREDLVRIVDRTVGAVAGGAERGLSEAELLELQAAVREVVVPSRLVDLAARTVLATQPERSDSPESVRRLVRYGAGPRGAQALVLAAKARAIAAGRPNATTADLAANLLPALRHRIALNFEGQSAGARADDLVAEAFAAAQAALRLDPVLDERGSD